MFTRNNNFELPDTGVQNWEASLSENFEIIEKGPTIKAIAGLTIAIDKVVYMNSSERLYLAISPTGATTASQFLGFTTTQINREVDGYVQTFGNHSNPDWVFTPGPVYLSPSSAGEVTQTEPAITTMVGYAIGTNELLIRPWMDNSFDHGTLTGLVDPADDHTQYLRTDNLRSTSGLTISGNLSVNRIVPETAAYINIGAGLTTTGNIGINIAVPQAPLTVKQDINTSDGGMSIGGKTGTENRYQIFVDGGDDLNVRWSASGSTPMILKNDGRLSINTATANAQLTVDQSSTTDAVPVLTLDQGDIDDTFIDFIGTSAADGTRSISSDTTEDSTKFGAIRIEINGVTKWIRIYDNES